MAVISLDATSTTFILNGTPITEFSEGDYITIAPVNPLTSRVNSANNGVNINKRIDGNVYDVTFRVQKYSSDDVFMTSQINNITPVTFEASAKEAFIRDGADFSESWSFKGGSITTLPTQTKNNQDGNAMMEYVIQFRDGKRNI